jgi:hypothetical protein
MEMFLVTKYKRLMSALGQKQTFAAQNGGANMNVR